MTIDFTEDEDKIWCNPCSGQGGWPDDTQPLGWHKCPACEGRGWNPRENTEDQK